MTVRSDATVQEPSADSSNLASRADSTATSTRLHSGSVRQQRPFLPSTTLKGTPIAGALASFEESEWQQMNFRLPTWQTPRQISESPYSQPDLAFVSRTML